MQRTIQITVSPDAAQALIADLRSIDGVIGLAHQPGASIVPSGDIITVHTINRAADRIMKTAQSVGVNGSFSVVTAELASVSDAKHQAAIDDDVDEAIWEELETGLRHQGRDVDRATTHSGLMAKAFRCRVSADSLGRLLSVVRGRNRPIAAIG